MYLGDQRQDLGDLRQDLGDQREDLDDKKSNLSDQKNDLNNSQVAMPQIEKQIGWAKPTQLPAGPREKRLIGRLFSSTMKLQKWENG